MTKLVPSERFPNGLAALEHLIVGATSISAAVAFVTDSGVRRLGELLSPNRGAAVEVVARGAGVTSPEALLALRDDLGVEVSGVMGRHAAAFHPKLWLVRAPGQLSVLSGSGNLTEGGLVDNEEQFEVIHLSTDTDAAQAHEARFDALTANAIPLDDLERSTIWSECSA